MKKFSSLRIGSLSTNAAKTNDFRRQHNFAGYCLEKIICCLKTLEGKWSAVD